MRPDPEPRAGARRPRPAAPKAAPSAPTPGAQAPPAAVLPLPLSDDELRAFNDGRHRRAWRLLGSHVVHEGGERRVRFAVWAPNAERVTVMGPFNGWSKEAFALEPLGSTGVWAGTFAEVAPGDQYKYHLVCRNGHRVDKRDPYAFHGEVPPGTASIVTGMDHRWRDAAWMRGRAERNAPDAPISIYELHIGSWRHLDLPDAFVTYRDLARPLVEHVRRTGFTHVEFMPLNEHPFYGSWGYQTTGYFAPSARYGSPRDLMHLVDALHQSGIGVILDWVPGHFPTDEHGLAYFDGTHLYEHEDPRRGFHPEWNSSIFNYDRNEVRSFLISSALFWLEVLHADGLRVDGVASMLYLDYGRQEGQWIPNHMGGRENLAAVGFLQAMNAAVHEELPGVLTVAEESTTWPGVTKPVEDGGLGFDLKWDMGWMHDTLKYVAREPVHRRWHHDEITFRGMYAFQERFLLPLSHDEVVYGKGSLLGKMPGDRWQRFANLRLLLASMWAQPGKKLLFMGAEIAQEREWHHDSQLDWWLLDDPLHAGVLQVVADCNALYRREPALHERDLDPAGFEWIDPDDRERSVFTFLRRDAAGRPLLVALNFTPVPRHNHRTAVPEGGSWLEVLNTDDRAYGGSGQGNLGGVEASPVPHRGRPFSLNLVLPPLAAVFLVPRP